MKKKCVNGIMFCRMNRKQYIRWVGVLFDLTGVLPHCPSTPRRLGRPLLLTHSPPPPLAPCVIGSETRLRLMKKGN